MKYLVRHSQNVTFARQELRQVEWPQLYKTPYTIIYIICHEMLQTNELSVINFATRGLRYLTQSNE